MATFLSADRNEATGLTESPASKAPISLTEASKLVKIFHVFPFLQTILATGIGFFREREIVLRSLENLFENLTSGNVTEVKVATWAHRAIGSHW
ncbi:MAG TPA: hypothetical protein VIT89_03735 [Solirubrobacterales bacterium]